MASFLKKIYRKIRHLWYYKPEEETLWMEQHNADIADIRNLLISLRKAVLDPDGMGMLSLRLRNAGCPTKYDYLFFEMTEGDVCIDGGANVGLVTDIFLSQGGLVYAFEPNPILYKKLLWKYHDNDRVQVYDKALSNSCGVAQFKLPETFQEHCFEYSVAGTICKWNHHSQKGQQKNYYEVSMISLADFIEDTVLQQHEQIYLLKLDVEGAEFDILEDLIQRKMYQKIKYIVCETHALFFADGEERLRRIHTLMEEKQITNIFLDWV